MSFFKKLKEYFLPPIKRSTRAKRREARLRLAKGKVGFVAFGEQDLEIHNISITGIAFMLDSFPKPPVVGDIFEGKLFVGDKTLILECFVVHVSAPYVGCEFTDDTEELSLALRQRFQIELKAHSLVKVRPEILKSWGILGTIGLHGLTGF